MGFPIRKSPDHSLLAASRSLSQLITSFFAYLRQGIHTHALSSLTIKSTSHTTPIDATFFALTFKTCVLYARQYSVVKDLDCFSIQWNRTVLQTADLLLFLLEFLVGLGGIEPPTSPLSGVRSSHLSYRPVGTKRYVYGSPVSNYKLRNAPRLPGCPTPTQPPERQA